MATSVSSKHAFSAAGITISKRRNRLGGDVVEALQFLKCFYRHNLLFREVDDPLIASETQLDRQMTSEDSNRTEEGWDDLIEEVNAGIECGVLDMEGNDDDDVVITEIN